MNNLLQRALARWKKAKDKSTLVALDVAKADSIFSFLTADINVGAIHYPDYIWLKPVLFYSFFR